jgi:dolichyl-phosphate-mannose--protein O-mannosyl transferase
MVENVESILKVVIFIAVGGTLAIAFFFVFAHIITGSKTTHEQLKKITKLNEEILQQLKDLNSRKDK